MTAAGIEPIGTSLKVADIDIAPPQGDERLVDVEVRARAVITSLPSAR